MMTTMKRRKKKMMMTMTMGTWVHMTLVPVMMTRIQKHQPNLNPDQEVPHPAPHNPLPQDHPGPPDHDPVQALVPAPDPVVRREDGLGQGNG